MKMTEIKRREYDRIDEESRMAGFVVAVICGLLSGTAFFISFGFFK